MSQPYRLLFVCLGNICRSPAGENVMRKLVSEAGLEKQVTCASAGTAGYHIGKSPDHRMTSTLKRRGIANSGAAAKLTKSDLSTYDMILAMDNENLRDIQNLDPEKRYHNKIRKFTDFCSQHPHSEVPDPYYGGDEGFEEVADLMFDGCANLLKHIPLSS